MNLEITEFKLHTIQIKRDSGPLCKDQKAWSHCGKCCYVHKELGRQLASENGNLILVLLKDPK